MATKDDELLETVVDELKTVDGALLAARTVTKALEGARDTLRFVRNVLENRPSVNSRTEGGSLASKASQ